MNTNQDSPQGGLYSKIDSRAGIVLLSTLTLLAGVAGMATSFLFLCTDRFANLMSGASGFVAGALLVATGLISLALVSRESRSVSS